MLATPSFLPWCLQGPAVAAGQKGSTGLPIQKEA